MFYTYHNLKEIDTYKIVCTRLLNPGREVGPGAAGGRRGAAGRDGGAAVGAPQHRRLRGRPDARHAGGPRRRRRARQRAAHAAREQGYTFTLTCSFKLMKYSKVKSNPLQRPDDNVKKARG